MRNPKRINKLARVVPTLIREVLSFLSGLSFLSKIAII